MNIVELLLKALEDGDWEFVSEAYFLLSGVRKEPSKSDDLSKMFSRLMSKQDLIATTVEKLHDIIEGSPASKKKKPVEKKEEKPRVDENFSVQSNKPSRRVTDRHMENKFDDMHDVLAEAEREQGYDKIDDNVERTNRTRKTYTTKTVTCTSCGAISEVNPMFARDGYICDRCLQKRGR